MGVFLWGVGLRVYEGVLVLGVGACCKKVLDHIHLVHQIAVQEKKVREREVQEV